MAEGLRFACQPGCTACCEQKGFVYLTDADIVRAAEFLGLPAAEFERRYVVRRARQARLHVPRKKRCNFLQDGGCSIHPAKPAQCRIFPFWPELIRNKANLRKTARFCPGIGQGPLIHVSEVRRQAQEMRDAYPEMYG
jgi:uncharacterized protein